MVNIRTVGGFACVLFCAALLLSCTKTVPGSREGLPPGAVLLRAGFESAASKVDISADGALTWNAGDEIAVWTSNGVAGKFCTFTLREGAGTATATFVGSPDEGYTVSTLAVYPAGAASSFSGGTLQVRYPDTYDYGTLSSAVRMAAWFDNPSDGLSFKHLGGVLRFRFTGIPSWVNTLRITTDKPIHGNFTVTTTQEGDKVVSSTSSRESQVEINFTEGAMEGASFNVPVPVGVYDFTVAFYVKDGSNYYLCSKTSCVTSSPKTVSRKKIVSLPAVTVAPGIAEGFVQGLSQLSPAVLSAEESTVAEGLTRLDVVCRYQDSYVSEAEEQQKPRKMFIFKVDLSCLTLRTTLAHEGESALWTLQKTTEQLQNYASARGVTVYGGVNGDFYDRTATFSPLNTPYGVMYKDGIALKATFSENEEAADWARTFALLNNGTARIWHSEKAFNDYAEKSSISEAISGRLSVVQEGNIVTRIDESLSPRTGIGLDQDGNTVWFAVVDGRDDAESAGASPRAMGIILKALGAYNAFNLDGGGSSTFACLEGGVIKLVNNPSDGSERAVPNAIAICPREGDLSSTVEDMDVHNNVEL